MTLELPYAGTSGWSGSTASQDRAEEEDSDGTTSFRQSYTLALLDRAEAAGLTWSELSGLTGWHHGQTSGVLSVLHKRRLIDRLTQRRERCSIYVLPQYVQDRQTAAQGRRRSVEGILSVEDREVVTACAEAVAKTAGSPYQNVQVPAKVLGHLLTIIGQHTTGGGS